MGKWRCEPVSRDELTIPFWGFGGDFTRSWLPLPLSHGTKVKGKKKPILGSSPQCPITCSTDAVPSSPSHSDAANPITMTTETSRRLASYQATSRKDRRNTLDLWTATKISIENHYIPLYYINYIYTYILYYLIFSVMLKRNLNPSSGQMMTRDWLGNFQTSKHSKHVHSSPSVITKPPGLRPRFSEMDGISSYISPSASLVDQCNPH